MTNFLVLNLQDFGLNHDVTDTIKTFNPFCISCLDKNAPLINLANCCHSGFLLNSQVEISQQYVCHQCHVFLKKITLFQKQVEDCNYFLKTHASYAETPYNNPMRKLNLTTTCTDIIDLPTTPDSVEMKKENMVSVPNFSEPIVTIHEVDDRQSTHNDDGDDDVPLKIVKRDKKVKRKIKNDDPTPNHRKRSKQSLYKRFEGKIKMIVLSHDEMLSERERDANSESYLNLPYRCSDCVIGFDHEPNFKGHLERRHNKKNGSAICDICKSVLLSTASLRKHLKNHYNRYECLLCSKRYVSLYSIVQHTSTEHGVGGDTYPCTHCDFVATTISALAYHRNKHRMNLQCTECGKQCSSTANLKTHLFAVHKKSDRMFVCKHCNKRYNTKSGLEHHNTTQHDNRNVRSDAYCVHCDIQFSTIRCYKAHLRLNSKHVSNDAKKFVCSECGARFVTNASMKRHVDWVHLKMFKHQCPNCMEFFRTHAHMEKHHKLVHEKIVPPRNKICQYCGKGFMTAQVLRAHIRTHTGERPLLCSLCPATFAHNAALYTHKKLIHKCVNTKNARNSQQ